MNASDSTKNPAPIHWQRGGHATLRALDGFAITLDSSISSPPGSRLLGKLPSGEELAVKVHGCKRQGEGFQIQGRIFNASRAVVAELKSALDD